MLETKRETNKGDVPQNSKPDFIQLEHEVLDFWEQQNIFGKLQEKNQQKPRFRFLDGPITANNPMGIHHAWGRSIKDVILRYKGMQGYSSLYRNGFDTQGLWVEVEVEKELGFKDKKDIETYGLDNFTRKCVERITKFSGVITQQSKRLGQWMDWDNSYYTHTDENIAGIWHFLKVCHQKGWIEQASRPMPWCPRCGTSLSEHEMTGSHKELTHTAVFARVPVVDKEFDILVWTTTPWTLSANVALAVNPELDYALVAREGEKRPLVMVKSALKYFPEKRQVLRIFKGAELVGLQYETFFPDLAVQKELVHRVVPWAEVAADEGSGVVHIAPGCGEEDYNLGQGLGLAEICPVDENGIFYPDYAFLSGLPAAEVAPLVAKQLQGQGKLVFTEEYTHSYPVCWRCKTEVLFRLVQEWYIRTAEIKPLLLAAVEEVEWQPSYMGKRMSDWLQNMGDWNISRKRYYGLPLPFYPCSSCGELTVVGSPKELAALGDATAVQALPELHRPWVDDIQITCPHCGEKVTRITEVGDVWLDAGITPFSTLGYFSDPEDWKRNFPAELVLEMREQVRLWFYSLLFMSVTLTGKAPYEKVVAHGSVVAEDGSKFSKTGFTLKFDETAERIGADAIRYLYASASMANDMRFGYNLGEEARRKTLGLWNIYTFFRTYAAVDQPVIGLPVSSNLLDAWLLARIQDFVLRANQAYAAYDTPGVIREFEICVDDVANWYVRANRRRFWKEALDADKQAAYNVLFYAIKVLTQVMAPIIPFLAEHIWQNMVLVYSTGEESVHLSDFPVAQQLNQELDLGILAETKQVRQVIALALKLRNEAGIKVKQPLSTLYLDADCAPIVQNYTEVIREELNIKEIQYLGNFSDLQKEQLLLDFKAAGQYLKGDLPQVKELFAQATPEEMAQYVKAYKQGTALFVPSYGSLPVSIFRLITEDKAHVLSTQEEISVAIHTEITPDLQREGWYREILRHAQVLRKEAGFSLTDRVRFKLVSPNPELLEAFNTYAQDFTRETLSSLEDFTQSLQSKTISLDGSECTLMIGS